MQEQICGWFRDSIQLRERIIANQNGILDQIESGARLAVESLQHGHKLLLCGNGGSAADAQHIAAELMVRYKSANDRDALPAISLTTDTSVLTACANDYSFEDIFARQVAALGQKGDTLIVFSTSGNSGNIIRAVSRAQEKGMEIIKFLGGTGGKLAGMAGVNIIVPDPVTARIQEVHITIGHMLCEFIDQQLFGFK